MTSPKTELSLRQRIEVRADRAQVWRALTDPERLAAWFPDAVELEGTQPGNRGWLVWNEHGRYAFEVVEVDEPRRLVWRWAEEEGKELADAHLTHVEWTLEERGDGGTTVEVYERGFSAPEMRDGNEKGWKAELAELVELLDG